MNSIVRQRFVSVLAVAFAVALAGGSNVKGQDPVFRVGAEEVVLNTTVVDKDDRVILALGRESFKVYEDNKLLELRYFAQEDVPVSVGILVDNSGSMRDKRRKVNTAAVDFVKESNSADEVFIVNFNDDAYLDSPFTNDIPRLQDALQRIDSRGGTALYDAVQMSLDYLKEKAKHTKRALFIISDGEDNASTVDLENLVRELQEEDLSQTTIYAIGILGEEEKSSAKRAKRAIRHITHATGGPVYFPETVDEIHELAKQIAYDIRNQYILAYAPPEGKPPGFRRIKIELAGKAKRYKVRHRPGYFSQ